jgi:hypothetical protein
MRLQNGETAMINRALLATAAWLGLGLVCLIGTYAHADEGYTCADVRAGVETVSHRFGVSRAKACEIIEAMARGAGATDAQIVKAKRCLQK